MFLEEQLTKLKTHLNRDINLVQETDEELTIYRNTRLICGLSYIDEICTLIYNCNEFYFNGVSDMLIKSLQYCIDIDELNYRQELSILSNVAKQIKDLRINKYNPNVEQISENTYHCEALSKIIINIIGYNIKDRELYFIYHDTPSRLISLPVDKFLEFLVNN